MMRKNRPDFAAIMRLKSVGLKLAEVAAELRCGQQAVKAVMAENGVTSWTRGHTLQQYVAQWRITPNTQDTAAALGVALATVKGIVSHNRAAFGFAPPEAPKPEPKPQHLDRMSLTVSRYGASSSSDGSCVAVTLPKPAFAVDWGRV